MYITHLLKGHGRNRNAQLFLFFNSSVDIYNLCQNITAISLKGLWQQRMKPGKTQLKQNPNQSQMWNQRKINLKSKDLKYTSSTAL